MDPQSLTAVILTRDEERNLPRALTSLPRGVRVLVFDAHSRDRTVEFARAAGALVLQREWTGFVDARAAALAAVETPWTLMLDADEALDDRLRDALLDAGDDVDGYVVRRTTYFCGKPMRLWRGEPLLRVFKTQRARLAARPAAGGTAALHERWLCDGAIAELPGELLHYSYPDAASYRTKYQRYTDEEADGTRGSLARPIRTAVVGTARLFWLLLVRGALLDGPRGAYVAWHSAFYPFVVAVKALRR